MDEHSKYTDINAVMLRAEADLVSIEKKYQDCLNKQTPPDDLLVEVKDCLGNMRSALDYLWCKVPNAGNGAHFPIANTQKEFENKTNGIEQKYLAVVEKLQPHNGNSWLKDFGYIRNKNVHVKLVPQIRQETKEFSVKSGGASATFRGCTFNSDIALISFGDVPMHVDQKTQFPIDTPGLDIERVTWVDFLFDGSSISSDFPEGISVLPFLKQSFVNTKTILFDIEKII